MKKFICMAALAAMVLSGCSSGSDSSASSSQAASSQTSSESSSQASSSSEQTSEEAQAELDALKEKMFTDGTNFPQLEEPEKGEEIAVFTTNKGVIKIKLCPEEAPKAVENFKGLINEGYYDGLTFHRVINGFMIQAATLTATERGESFGAVNLRTSTTAICITLEEPLLMLTAVWTQMEASFILFSHQQLKKAILTI